MDEPAPLIVDARGMRCPWPILRAAKAMRANRSIVLISDDPIARKDVPDMARARGWRCEISESDNGTQFLLER